MERSIFVIKERDLPKDIFEENFKEMLGSLEESLKKKNKKEDKPKKSNNEEEEQVDADENIESYYNYTVNTISLFYLPVITLLIWQFYDETAISPQWSIKQKDFFFYFLFAVVIIPFQMAIDILCFNVMTLYHDLDYLSCLKKWNQGIMPLFRF